MTNNTMDLNLSKTELSLKVSEKYTNNVSYFVAEINSESYIDTSGTLKISNEDGNVIYTKKIESIPAQDITYAFVSLNELISDFEEQVLLFEIVSDKDEYYTNNNVTEEYAKIISNKIPYVMVTFIDKNGDEISRDIYNAGSSVTPPALPNKAYSWIRYGDSKQTLL